MKRIVPWYTIGVPAKPGAINLGGRRKVLLIYEARLPPGFIHLPSSSVSLFILLP
ncbi:hypothetical protein H6A33_04355 [Collinsella tanakaei]|uniref:hypothetical protein n=1 Tax=Collinsella ihumii TaxID=1720204 RepID=UPI0013798C19|nr:hypothetical protein [Collinsella ihumii]MBM6785434.1 hypothetical protein [Collinsella tanakaei]